MRYNKPSILQQQEIENGGPYTPSPAPTPAKSQQQTPVAGPSSPAVRASSALNAALQEATTPTPAPVASVEAPPRPIIATGFTPVNVNGGGFTAVNAPQPAQIPLLQTHSSFSVINAPNGLHRPETAQSTPQRSDASPLSSAKNTPDLPPIPATGLGLPPALNGQTFSSLKRGISSDLDSGTSGDADAAGRKSKRVKKGEFCHTSKVNSMLLRGHGFVRDMVQPRLPPAQLERLHLPRDRSKEKPGDVSVFLSIIVLSIMLTLLLALRELWSRR